jgi:uncharacterized membrane protein YidH (DUF202 family)
VVPCLNEKGRKMVVISIILIVVGVLSSYLAWEDYLARESYQGYMYPDEVFFFFAGILMMIIGFGLLAYIYIKIDKYKNHS